MKPFYLFLLIFTLISLNSFSQGNSNEAFNQQIALAEKAIQDRDLTIANAAYNGPLSNFKNKTEVKNLKLKIDVLECILKGKSSLSSEKWDDAIEFANKGIAFVSSKKTLFVGGEKEELEKIKLDAENGKKGIKINSTSQATTNNNPPMNNLNDLGDPIDYNTGYSQMMTNYENEKNAPYEEFEKRKDTMELENMRRIEVIKNEIVTNEKKIDSALVKIDVENDNRITSISKNQEDFLKYRDTVIESQIQNSDKIATDVSNATIVRDSLVENIYDENVNRNNEIRKSIDSSSMRIEKVKKEIENENDKRFQSISNSQKELDTLSRLVEVGQETQRQSIVDNVENNTKMMDEYRKKEPEKPKGSGMLNSKGVPYQKGITQGVFAKGEKGKTQMIITRRVKIDENNNVDIYLKHETPNTVTTYTKNGATITEYTWSVESGNVTFFE
jgi:hypothetical protein